MQVGPKRAQRSGGHGEEHRVAGHRLWVLDRGDGPPLLLLMGIGGNVGMWAPFTDALRERRTVAFDAPGTGWSSTPPFPLPMSGLAALTTRLLDVLGLERVDVLGYSFGGALAQELALRSPERVRRLVLAATTCGIGGVPGEPAATAALLSPNRYYSAAALARVAPGLFGGRIRRDPSALAPHVAARLAAPPSRRGYAWQVAAIAGWSSRRWLHQIPHPTLVLAGDDDPVTPVGNGRLLASAIPHATLRVVPGGGHLFLLDSAPEVAPLVEAFLAAGDGTGDDSLAA